ncbi:PTS sugar transporter subunit IIB [Fannyhessea vaginae]|uniref:PTS sugar transporter subunit IIB n=1 Tax=Fannyhessea vaginae TaxID=82135 RepID=UPI00288A56C2|nr:PTS sugar transporter subunit IIB [Fannyhessea vaginae]
MKIFAVCGFGVGSSVIAKMNIEQIIANRNLNDIEVDTVDLGSVQGVDADLFVTTHEMYENFPDELKPKTVAVDNFVEINSLEEVLLPYLCK